jgi:hypothetical protein
MTIVNKRNAVVGYVTLKVGKRVARKKAKEVGGKLTPWRSTDSKNSKSSKNSKNGKKSS